MSAFHPLSPKRRVRHAVGAVFALLLVGSCSDSPLFVDPAPIAGDATLAITLSAVSWTATMGGPSEAYDKAEVARFRVARLDGETVIDTAIALEPEGTTIRSRFPVGLRRPGETFQVTARLDWRDQALFTGRAEVVLEPGEVAQAEIPLQPVVAAVRGPDSPPVITAIGNSLQLSAATLFATGDTIPDTTLAWSSLTPDVVEVSASGTVTARADGEALVRVTHESLADTVAVTVRAAVASVEVTPGSAVLFPDSVQQFQAIVKDANGNVLTREVRWVSSDPRIATVDEMTGVVRGVSVGGPVLLQAVAEAVVATFEVTVIAPPVIALSSAEISFRVVQGETAPDAQSVEVRNAGGGTLSDLSGGVRYPAGSPVGWLSAELSGTTAPTTLTVRPNTSELEPGTYTVSVVLRSALLGVAADTLQVTYEVAPARPTPPREVDADATGTLVVVSWQTASAYVQEVRVERRAGGGEFTEIAKLPGSATSYQDAVGANTSYSYRLRACNQTGCSSYSETASVSTMPAAPTALRATLDSSAAKFAVALAWQDNSLVEGEFRVQRRVGQTGAWALLTTLGANAVAFRDTTVENGVTYSYQVVACNLAGCSAPAGPVSATTGTPPTAATDSLASLTASSATLTGSVNPNGLPTSVFFEWTSGTTLSGAQTISTTAVQSVGSGSEPILVRQLIEGLAAEQTYTYRVVAQNSLGTAAGASITFTTPPLIPAAPSNLTASLDGPVYVYWTDSSDNETEFRLERRVGQNGVWTLLATLGANSSGYVDSNIESGFTYFYRLSACNAAGCSASAGPVSVLVGTLPTAATDSLASLTASSATLTGSVNPNGLPTSVFFEWTSGTTLSGAQTISTTAVQSVGSGSEPILVRQLIEGLAAEQTYTYRVVAQNSLGTAAGASITFTTPPPIPAAPSGLYAAPDGPVYLSWTDNSNNETEFRLERRDSTDGVYTLIATIPGDTTSYVDRNVSDFALYFYRIQACNRGGCSGFDVASTAMEPTVSTSAATNVQPNASGSGTATISGSVDPYENDYTVWFEYYSGTINGTTLVPSSTLAQTTVREGTSEQVWQETVSVTNQSPALAYRIVSRSLSMTSAYGAWKCVDFSLNSTTQDLACTIQQASFNRAEPTSMARIRPR